MNSSDPRPLPEFAPVSAESRRIVPDTKVRDTIIAVMAGAAVLCVILYAVFYFGRQAEETGGVTGLIVHKEFVSRPETQVTVGTGGLSSRQVDGDYIFEVRWPARSGRIYKILVNPQVYHSYKEGENYYFIRPDPRG